MRKFSVKKFLALAALSACVAVVPVLGGCAGESGRDGINGKDLTIYDIWQETKVQTNNPDLTYEQFLREYLSYSPEEIENQSSLQASINRSLLSGVSIISTFTEYTYVGSQYGHTQYISSEASYFGSGVIVDADTENGDITVVTNCHVIYSAAAKRTGYQDTGMAKSVKLWLYGTEYDEASALTAQVVGASKSYDIAVLKVEGNQIVKNSKARAAEWYSGEECFLGETVYTIGNADGKKLAASVGYISKDSEEINVNLGTDSNVESYAYRVMRTDTAISGGNSGGGLYNKNGEILGIVNAKSIAEQVDNMGYALPAATTKRVVERLIEQNDGAISMKVVSPAFKCVSADIYSTGLNAQGFAEIKEVVKVSAVDLFSPAFNKLSVGDVITAIKISRGGNTVVDMPVNRLHNVSDAFLSVYAGDSVTISFKRNGEEREVTINYTSDDVSKVD